MVMVQIKDSLRLDFEKFLHSHLVDSHEIFDILSNIESEIADAEWCYDYETLETSLSEHWIRTIEIPASLTKTGNVVKYELYQTNFFKKSGESPLNLVIFSNER